MIISLDEINYPLSSTKTKPNKIIREKIVPFFHENNVKTILDFGCGRYLRDSLYLTKEGFIVNAVDIKQQINNINEDESKKINNLSSEIKGFGYDAALLNFVIQVLPEKKKREEIINQVYEAVKKEGYFICSVRTKRSVNRSAEKNGIPFKDGFLMQKGKYYTFVKGYEKKELESILDSFNLNILNIYCPGGEAYITLSKK